MGDGSGVRGYEFQLRMGLNTGMVVVGRQPVQDLHCRRREGARCGLRPLHHQALQPDLVAGNATWRGLRMLQSTFLYCGQPSDSLPTRADLRNFSVRSPM